MTNGLYTTAVGLVPQMYQQEVIANNIANVNTTGYKKDNMLFRRILEAEQFKQMHEGDYNFIPQVQDTHIDFHQGTLIPTGNSLDFAIEGEGYFIVETPNSLAYTRNGNFTINSEGILVSNGGYPVMGEDGVIEIDEQATVIQISEQGEIFINNVQTNKFQIANFEDKQALIKNGDSLFVPRDENVREMPLENVRIKQGFLEQSNVNPVEEMVGMLVTVRQFESLQKSIQFHNETLQKSVNELGRITE